MDYLKVAARKTRTWLKNDWDALVAFTGLEGSGKSVAAMQFAMLVDPSFTLDRIIYSYQKQRNIIEKAPRYGCVLHDEFGLEALGREAMTKANISLIKSLMVCRRENKALIVCAPSFWMLDPYVRNHRCSLWVHLPLTVFHQTRLRGYAKFREPVPNEFGDTPFWKTMKLYRFQNIPESAYEAYKAHKEGFLKVESIEDIPKVRERDQMILDAYKRRCKIPIIAKVVGLSERQTWRVIQKGDTDTLTLPTYL